MYRFNMNNKRSLILVLLLVLLSVNCNLNPHPSDSFLLQNFQENEKDFNLLVGMAKKDSNMIRIAYDFTWTEDSAAYPRPKSEMGISDERWSSYKKLFAKLGLKAGILNYQPDRVELISSTEGLLTGGSSKGYIYLEEEPEILENSLDNYDITKFKKEINYVYRKIKGNWYLYYEVSG